MAKVQLHIGNVKREHVEAFDYELYRRHGGTIILGVKSVKEEVRDPEVYMLNNGVIIPDDEIDAMLAEMRENMLGKDAVVVGVLWGYNVDRHNGAHDFTWLFEEENVLLHGFAHIGDDGEPWVEFSED